MASSYGNLVSKAPILLFKALDDTSDRICVESNYTEEQVIEAWSAKRGRDLRIRNPRLIEEGPCTMHANKTHWLIYDADQPF
jgi:hypothetical protein